MYYYQFYNYTLKSEVSLKGLVQTAPVENADLSIFYEKLNLDFRIIPRQRLYLQDTENCYFIVEGIAYFQLVSGAVIKIEKDQYSPLEEMTEYLLNHVLVLALNQRKEFLIQGTSFEKNGKNYLVTGSPFGTSVIIPALSLLGFKIISERLNKIGIINENPYIFRGFQTSPDCLDKCKAEVTGRIDEMIELRSYPIPDFETESLQGAEKITSIGKSVLKNDLTAMMQDQIIGQLMILAKKCKGTRIKMPQVNFSLEGLINNLLSTVDKM